jgi:hypothetical protein
MDDDGYGPAVCLALDDAFLSYVQQFERMRDATTWVPDPSRQHRKAKPQKEVHVYSKDEILAFLDITDAGDIDSPIVANALDALDPALWEAMDGWDDDDASR